MLGVPMSAFLLKKMKSFIRNILVALLVLIFFNCNHSLEKVNHPDTDGLGNVEPELIEETLINPKAKYYLNLMQTKNYSISMNAPCEDALSDNTVKRNECLILKETYENNTATINFKFKAACCQEFMGDYIIKNNKIIFNMEQVNDIVCGCICWYHYELKINNLNNKVNKIDLNFIDN